MHEKPYHVYRPSLKWHYHYRVATAQGICYRFFQTENVGDLRNLIKTKEFEQGRQNEPLLGLSCGLTDGGDHLQNKIWYFLHEKNKNKKQKKNCKNREKMGKSPQVECGHPA